MNAPRRRIVLSAAAGVLVVATGVSIAVIAGKKRPPEPRPPLAGNGAAGEALPTGALARLGNVRWRMALGADWLAFTGDGRRLVTYGNDRSIYVFDAATGERPIRTRPQPGGVAAIALSHGGSWCAIATGDRGLLVVDASAVGPPRLSCALKFQARFLGWSASDQFLVALDSEGAVHLVEPDTGREAAAWKIAEGAPLGMACPSKERVVITSEAGNLRVRSLDGGAVLQTVAVQGLSGFVSATPDGRLVAAAAGKKVVVVDGPTATVLGQIEETAEVTGLALHPEGKSFATVANRPGVRVWNVATRERISELDSGPTWASGVAWSPDGRLLAAVAEDKQVYLWDALSGRRVHDDPGHSGSIAAARWSPDGSLVATAGQDGLVILWDATTWEFRRRSHRFESAVTDFDFSPDARTVFVVLDSGDVWRCPIEKGDRARLDVPRGAARRIAVHPDGKRLVIGGADTLVRVIDAATGGTLRELPGFESVVTDVCVSRDGRFVAAAGDDRTARIWPADGGEALVLRGAASALRCVDVRPDGGAVVAGSHDAKIHVWNAADGSPITVIHGFDGEVLDVAYSPDGTRVLGAAVGNSVRVCDVATGVQVVRFTGGGGRMATARWSADGLRIVSAGDVTHALVWAVPARR